MTFVNYTSQLQINFQFKQQMTVGQVIKNRIKGAGFSMNEISERLSMSRQALHSNLSKALIPDDFIDKFKKYVPEIDLKDINDNVNDIQTKNTAKTKFEISKGIPYYDIDITAGDVPVYFDMEKNEPEHYINIFGFDTCTQAFPVYGHSMYPKICSGDIGLFQYIEDKSSILWGSIYLVITDQYRTLKFLRKGKETGWVILKSENPDFDDIDLETDKILHLFLYKGKIEKNQM